MFIKYITLGYQMEDVSAERLALPMLLASILDNVWDETEDSRGEPCFHFNIRQLQAFLEEVRYLGYTVQTQIQSINEGIAIYNEGQLTRKKFGK